MSSDLEDFEEQITELIQGIQQVLDREIPSLKGEERTQKCHYLKNRLNRARQVHRSIVVEIRGLSGSAYTEWDGKAKSLDERLGKLGQDIEWAETSHGNAEGGPVKKKNMDEMTSVEMTKQALLIQDKTQESTARTQRILDETIQVGVTVQTELKQQGEKIRQVDEDVERIESNLRRADKQMRVFVRRMGNDKIFMFMILLMVVGIIIAIVFTVLKKKCPTAVQGILCSAPTATS
ncbi:hypothetical protein BATDEDRAFT_92109 [Batrachochytrium dendrobatidis JAM81]|uniref:t-SNARE coiled-coil homology domain-containing protein n=2 Tax=Batrachochytrium dendrobatidis TaxID=109871 RepID=F4PCZ1_BATDJ|nr:uncharacterized protein BATDEDRAFT_92109 [Batrachochytrium dendrobatidis JAM81]EGF76834.1 hypothetical protein BATDEDRAFT_92109 [Batrachochytrium dendrobatidis JAM81]KAJ8331031.1 hypothetical protein O5D80_001040 [Batrachochytrium dendrobatidis]KAK5672399.1 hypothetical protein QVD99_001166 [Batrachochytrium dendrobatidis]OAJ45047.1 hypothetical protein BDEG_28215 [Batrachochytrium dendrobatidis JEL423]|eukprot:XP_006682472.1 hypothetical protein BATDEDRAFT_92109 [Batrachochytrium dendrobatidis JAM81]